jgi:hypothetical protein
MHDLPSRHSDRVGTRVRDCCFCTPSLENAFGSSKQRRKQNKTRFTTTDDFVSWFLTRFARGEAARSGLLFARHLLRKIFGFHCLHHSITNYVFASSTTCDRKHLTCVRKFACSHNPFQKSGGSGPNLPVPHPPKSNASPVTCLFAFCFPPFGQRVFSIWSTCGSSDCGALHARDSVLATSQWYTSCSCHAHTGLLARRSNQISSFVR